MVQDIGKYLQCVRLLPPLQVNSRVVGYPYLTRIMEGLPVIRWEPGERIMNGLNANREDRT